jgi:hypothetical protein
MAAKLSGAAFPGRQEYRREDRSALIAMKFPTAPPRRDQIALAHENKLTWGERIFGVSLAIAR